MKRLWNWPWRFLHGGRGCPRRSAKARLTVEVLEDRLALSADAVSSLLPDLASEDPLAHARWREERYHIVDLSLADAAGRDQRVGLDVLTSSSVEASDSRMASLIGLDRVFADYPYRGTGYSVAVLDTGIDYTHPDLGGRVIAGWDFVNNDVDPMDDQGHGTHVAGIIGGSNSSYTGVAPDVNLIGLKVLDAQGSGSFAAVEDALRWVINHQAQYNIVAINLSLGTGNFTSNPYTFLEDEFQGLKDRGVFIAAAAGNSFYAYNSQVGVGFPAISPRAVSVGAVWDGDFGGVSWRDGAIDYTTAADRITSFTQRGPGLDILAPGALITSTYLGGTYRTMAGTSMATPVVAGAAALLHQALDASGHAAQANQDYILQLMQTYGAVVNDGDDENDNVSNTGLNFRRLDLNRAISSLSPILAPPVVNPIADQTITRAAGLVVNFTASDPDTILTRDNLSVSIKSVARTAYDLDQQLALRFVGNYYQNALGQNEKHMLSDAQGVPYFITPDGSLFRYGTSFATSTLVTKLDPSFWTTPALLHDAQLPGAGPSLNIQISPQGGNNYQLSVSNFATFAGTLVVTVTAADGSASTSQNFRLTVTNQAPVLNGVPSADQSVSPNAVFTDNFTVSDAENDVLTLGTTVQTLARTAFELDQQLALRFVGNYYQNALGQNEKHMLSDAQSIPYFITPDGSLYRYGGSFATSTLVTRLDSSFWTTPALLHDAVPGATPSLNIQITAQGGNNYQIAIGNFGSFTGPLVVTVTASDGVANVSNNFRLTVSNQPPTLTGLDSDRSVSQAGALTVDFVASDAEGALQTPTVAVQTLAQQAFALDQQLALRFVGNYYQNALGQNEKHMLSDAQSIPYFITPDGSLYRYGGSFATSTLVTRLDSSFWTTPALLHDAVPGATPSLNIQITAQGGNNYQIAIGNFGSFTGVLVVTVTASDGVANVSNNFRLTVSNQPPTLTGLDSDRSVSQAGALTVDFVASDAEGALQTPTVAVQTLAQQAFVLDQQLALRFVGNYYQNALGQNEKHMLSDAQSIPYFITPDGSLYRYGGSFAASTRIARFDSSYWTNPALLHAAPFPAPEPNPTTSITNLGGNNYRLTISNFGGVTRTLVVTARASDGFASAQKTILVTVF